MTIDYLKTARKCYDYNEDEKKGKSEKERNNRWEERIS